MRLNISLLTILFLLLCNPGKIQSQNILFFGDSITAGLGVDNSQAYPAVIQNRIDSLGWDYNVINGGLSGETSAGGLRRIDWMLRTEVDLFVLELGGNDGLRGISVSATKENLHGIIEKVHTRYPDARIVLAGMQVPTNLGQRYTEAFRDMYYELAEENSVDLIPFILEGVALNPDLMQGDDIHPNAEGHRAVADNVWEIIEPILRDMRG